MEEKEEYVSLPDSEFGEPPSAMEIKEAVERGLEAATDLKQAMLLADALPAR